MSQPNYAIARGSRVLVTGANGYIASHIIDILLELGFNVRGTVRTEKPWLDRYFENKFGVGRFESTVVPAMEEESAFDKVMKDVVGLVHVVCNLRQQYLQLLELNDQHRRQTSV
jgi:nucleoside-diphosphate-sugar epimerase